MILLIDANQPAEAFDIYDAIKTLDLQDQISRQRVEVLVLRFKGESLWRLGRSVESLEVLGERQERFAESPIDRLRESAEEARSYKKRLPASAPR